MTDTPPTAVHSPALATPQASPTDSYGRLDVTILQAVYEAGKASTVPIVIRNPFDKPVEIVEIQGPRSSHIEEVSQRDSAGQTQQQAKKQKWSLTRYLRGFYVSEIRVGGITAEFPKQRRIFNINAAQNSEITVDTDLSEYDTINVEAAESATVMFAPQNQPPTAAALDRSMTTIESHCEAVAYFQVRTSGWLFFTPTRQSLSTQIRYRIDGKQKTQVASSEFEIKPPLLSIVIGAIIGAVLGTLAKIFNTSQTFDWQPTALALGASTVMSLIAAIALSRKSASQAFITVEDFFGGFVVGALIGYGGSQYFERAIVPETTNTNGT